MNIIYTLSNIVLPCIAIIFLIITLVLCYISYDNSLFEKKIDLEKMKRDSWENCRKHKPLYRLLKRLYELIASLTAIIILLPVLCIISVLIKIEDGGPIMDGYYVVGKKKRKIFRYKFRTNKLDIKDKYNETGKMTKVGRILHKTALDQFPVLFNVIKGEFSIIGLSRYSWEKFKNNEEIQNLFEDDKPGMVSGVLLDNDPFISSLEKRMLYDKFYSINKSFKLDIVLMFRCIVFALK